MATPIGSIIKRATRREGEPLNILSWTTHERYQSNFAKCNANFYLLQNGNGSKGVWKQEYAAVPNNHILLQNFQNNPFEVIPQHVDIDLILSQHKFGLVQAGLQLSQYLGVPLINLEHTMPTSPELEQAVPQLKQLNGDVNVFISNFNRERWGYSSEEAIVIEHAVDFSLFKSLAHIKKQNQIITVANDAINRSYILGFDIVQEVIINNKLPLKVIGDTKGFSEPAKNPFDLVRQLNESLIYFCPARLSPIPTSLLEGMACGLCPVVTDNCVKSELIVDGVNGFKSNDNNVLLSYLQKLLANPDEAIRLGKAARQTIIDRYNPERFTREWNGILDQAARIVK